MAGELGEQKPFDETDTCLRRSRLAEQRLELNGLGTPEVARAGEAVGEGRNGRPHEVTTASVAEPHRDEPAAAGREDLDEAARLRHGKALWLSRRRLAREGHHERIAPVEDERYCSRSNETLTGDLYYTTGLVRIALKRSGASGTPSSMKREPLVARTPCEA